MFLSDGRVEDRKERDERRWGKSSWETGIYKNFVCKSTYHLRCGRSMSRSGMYWHRYVVFPNQSGNSYPWFLIFHQIVLILHPPSLSFSSRTLSSSQNKKSSHPSLSLHAIIMSWHEAQAYTKYSIHRVQYTPSTAYTEYSIYPRLFVFLSFAWVRVDPWM